jgi:hypothetical protein
MTPAIQERFDALARGLATGRLTRWEVIKGLGSGMLLGFAGLLQPWSASFAEAQTPAVKKAPVGSLSNPRKDSVRVPTCWEFNDYIQHTGVTDEEGNNHPTLGGYTSYKCGIEHSSYEYRVTPKSKPGHVCISVTKLNVTFEVSYKVTVIDWRPPTPQSAGCRAEETYFQESLVDHERVHVGHMKNAVAAANSRWKKNPPQFGLTCA